MTDYVATNQTLLDMRAHVRTVPKNSITTLINVETLKAILNRIESSEIAMFDLLRIVQAAKYTPTFQDRVRAWLTHCFGFRIATDKRERSWRFFEEAIELAQAVGMTESECRELITYVYGRDRGEIKQEVGGVMLTLSALCSAHLINMDTAADDELKRAWQNTDTIRRKQMNKPKGSPLPQKVDTGVRKDAKGNEIPWAMEHDYFMAFDPDNPDVPTD